MSPSPQTHNSLTLAKAVAYDSVLYDVEREIAIRTHRQRHCPRSDTGYIENEIRLDTLRDMREVMIQSKNERLR